MNRTRERRKLRLKLWTKSRQGKVHCSRRSPIRGNFYFFLVSRKSGDSARVKRTTSSPVAVLMS